jgi:hypothetical protein
LDGRPGRPAATGFSAGGDAVALSLAGPGLVLVWVRAAGYSQDEAKHGYEQAVSESMRDNKPLRYSYAPLTVRAARVTLTGLRHSGWLAESVSTSDGSVLQREGVIVPASGTVTLVVPDLTRDVALRLTATAGA